MPEAWSHRKYAPPPLTLTFFFFFDFDFCFHIWDQIVVVRAGFAEMYVNKKFLVALERFPNGSYTLGKCPPLSPWAV